VQRAAGQSLALQADVRAVTQSTMEQISVVAALGRPDLLCMMTRDARDVGLLVVDIGLLTALVELQALGQVTSVHAKERAPTSTDAVVVSDMLDKWMADVARAAGEAGLAQKVAFAGFVREHGSLGLRAVGLTLDPGQYRSIRITMAHGGEAKVDVLTFFVPSAAETVTLAGDGTLGARLRAHVMDAPAGMQAILTRFNHPLERVLALRVGDVLEIIQIV
jgi:flagellar motor switch protein FliM